MNTAGGHVVEVEVLVSLGTGTGVAEYPFLVGRIAQVTIAGDDPFADLFDSPPLLVLTEEPAFRNWRRVGRRLCDMMRVPFVWPLQPGLFVRRHQVGPVRVQFRFHRPTVVPPDFR